MSLLAWQDGVQTSLQSMLERAGAVAAPADGESQPAHFGSAAGELAACSHAVGLLVTGTGDPVAGHAPSATVSFELLGRRVDKVIRDLADLRPEIRWSRPSAGTAITTAAAEDAVAMWCSLVEAGRGHGLANVGRDAAARFRLLESGQA